jgi:hypothetical protein
MNGWVQSFAFFFIACDGSFYRYSYNGSDKAYFGVMAQEVQSVRPEAVMRGHDGYLWLNYEMLGLRRMTWDQWVVSAKRFQRLDTEDCRAAQQRNGRPKGRPFRFYSTRTACEAAPVDPGYRVWIGRRSASPRRCRRRQAIERHRGAAGAGRPA